MSDKNLTSLIDYSNHLALLQNRPTIEHTTLAVWSDSPFTGIAEGEIFFLYDFKLRIREELDFDEGLITAYGYEIYHGKERLCWYDDYPHPNDAELASTFPHHKHIPPNIKRNRVTAPNINFSQCNLSELIQEVEDLIKQFKTKQNLKV